jgi:hypothetical protein
MKKNFSISSMVEILYKNNLYDLHNDFNAIKIEIDTINNRVTILWHSVRTVNIHCSFQFNSVSNLFLRGFDVTVPRKEDQRLSFIGYLHPEDESRDGFLTEDMAFENYHIIFNFEGGIAIKVYAESVDFSVFRAVEP